MKPTDEQIAIVDAVTKTSDNLMIPAYAGTGKSSTLLMLERALNGAKIIYLAFNKSAVEKIKYDESADPDEADKRVLPTTHVKTLNSLGHGVWSATQCKNLEIDAGKSRKIFRDIAAAAPKLHQDAIWSVYDQTISGVSLAKALGYIPEGKYPAAKRLITKNSLYAQLDETPDELTADLIDEILLRSIKASFQGLCDFDDQVYMPALFGGSFPSYAVVATDEYQDLSPVNHEMLRRLCRKSRHIGVGDQYQTIYAFRGAKAGGMSEAIAAYGCATLPLSISFRCPSEIVKHVHWRVPEFKWSRTGGLVERSQRLRITDLPEEATFICRNNAPLFRLAMQLLGQGRSITITGSDIGPRLVRIMRKLGPEDLRRDRLLEAIAEWEADKLEKESKSAPDMAACMRVFASHGSDLAAAIGYAEWLFKQRGSLTFTTGHKAKGQEWDTVYHLDPWLVRKHPTDQDMNLDYVISTRAKERLIEINSEDIEP